jgi:hypothetical protein
LWLLPFVQGSPDLTSSQFQRSVVLFNTWQQAPLDVPQRQPEGECHDDDPQNTAVRSKRDWNEMLVDYDHSSTQAESSEPLKRTKIWLLGDLTRRNHEMRTVNLFSVERPLREALEHHSQPRRTTLFQQQS